MGNLKEKILYYFEVYKKQIILGGIILIFIVTSILIYYLFFSNNKLNEKNNKDIDIQHSLVKNEETLTNEEVKQENDSENTEISEKEIKKVIVDIKGEVKKPGVYEIEENKRINDVIKLAGGLTKNASTLVNNLSRKVEDEMVIIIYSKTDIEDFKKKKEEENTIIEEFDKVEDVIINDSVVDNLEIDSNTNIDNDISNSNNNQNNNQDSNSNTDSSDDVINSDGKISINTASKEELMQIDGIGASKADAIIKYRTETAKFENIEDIMNVSGIGETMFNKIKDKITI